MATAIVAKRLNQKAAVAVGAFNGKIEILAIYNKAKAGYFANVKVFSAANVFEWFTPAEDGGAVKKFSSVTAIMTWVNGAFLDITDMSATIDDMIDLSQKFVLPANPVTEVARLKAKFQKLKAALVITQTKLAAEKANAAALGYDTSIAPAAQAAWAEYLKREAVLNEIGAFYDAKVVEYTTP
jgi:hypothetical protein